MKLLIHDIVWPNQHHHLPTEVVADTALDLMLPPGEDARAVTPAWLAKTCRMRPTSFQLREWKLQKDLTILPPEPGTIARLALQAHCPDTGKLGCFLYVGLSHRSPGCRITEVYSTQDELFSYMRKAGWEEIQGRWQYILTR